LAKAYFAEPADGSYELYTIGNCHIDTAVGHCQSNLLLQFVVANIFLYCRSGCGRTPKPSASAHARGAARWLLWSSIPSTSSPAPRFLPL
jgi:hypothetical protein